MFRCPDSSNRGPHHLPYLFTSHLITCVYLRSPVCDCCVADTAVSCVSALRVPLNNPGPSQGFFLLKGSHSSSVVVLWVSVTHIERLLMTTGLNRCFLLAFEAPLLLNALVARAAIFFAEPKPQISTERAFPYGRRRSLPVCHNSTLFQLLCKLQ